MVMNTKILHLIAALALLFPAVAGATDAEKQPAEAVKSLTPTTE